MAYRDENGKITIDEIAAQKDIQKLTGAVAALEKSRNTLNAIINQAATAKGRTCDAAIEKANELIGQITSLINVLNESKTFINRTVKHYQQLDAELKAIIAAQKAAAEITSVKESK